MANLVPVKNKKPKRSYSLDENGVRKPSVTEILGKHLGWKTNALIGWAHKLGKEGRSLSERDAAASRGSCAHDLVAAHYDPDNHGDLSEWRSEQIDEAKPNALRVIDEISRLGWKVIACEIPMESDSFAGTLDLVVRTSAGEVLIVDLKTGKGAYNETVIQIGSYAWLWRLHCYRTMAPEVAGSHVATAGAVLHAPYGSGLTVHTVTPAALVAGEQAFRLLLDLHAITPQIRLGA